MRSSLAAPTAERFTNTTKPREEFHLRATDHMEEELINALRASPPRLGRWRSRPGGGDREPVQVPNILEEREYTPRDAPDARALRFPASSGRSAAA